MRFLHPSDICNEEFLLKGFEGADAGVEVDVGVEELAGVTDD